MDSSSESHLHALSHFTDISDLGDLAGVDEVSVQLSNPGVFSLTGLFVLFYSPLLERFALRPNSLFLLLLLPTVLLVSSVRLTLGLIAISRVRGTTATEFLQRMGDLG